MKTYKLLVFFIVIQFFKSSNGQTMDPNCVPLSSCTPGSYAVRRRQNRWLTISLTIQIRAPKTAAYYISPIEIGVFWLGIKCLKSATKLLNRVSVGRGGLDLYKEVLWVSVCQRAAELPAGKVGGLKKNSATRPGAGESVSNPAAWQNFFQTSNFASW